MAFYQRIGNFTAVAWCSLGSGLLGLFLLIIGAVLTGVAYTEITPPNYDENYFRYQGSNMMRIVGECFDVFTVRKRSINVSRTITVRA